MTNWAVKAAKGGWCPSPMVSAAAGDGDGMAGAGHGKVKEALVVTVKGAEEVKKYPPKALCT